MHPGDDSINKKRKDVKWVFKTLTSTMPCLLLAPPQPPALEDPARCNRLKKSKKPKCWNILSPREREWFLPIHWFDTVFAHPQVRTTLSRTGYIDIERRYCQTKYEGTAKPTTTATTYYRRYIMGTTVIMGGTFCQLGHEQTLLTI